MKGISQQIIKKIAVALDQLNRSIQTLSKTAESSTLEPENKSGQDNHPPAGNIEHSAATSELQQTQISTRLAEADRWRRRYEAALRASNQVLYDYDVQTNTSTWNGDTIRILSYSTAELGNREIEFWLSLIHPDDRPRFAAAAELTLTQGQPFRNLEYRLQRKDGSYIWIQDNNEPILDEAGNPVQIIGFIADITDRKQTELEQQRLLKRLSDLEFALDQAAIVATTDLQGRITHVNDRFCEISQYSREELLGNTHRLINSDYHCQSFFQDLWGTISRGQVWKGEIKNRAKDGSEYWVDTVIVPLLDGQGQPFQYLAIRFEVTERKRAELALLESQQLIQQIADSSPNVIYIYDIAQQRNIYVNREVVTFLGYTSNEVMERVDQSLATLMHPDDLEQAAQHFEQFATLPDGAICEFEYRMRHKNGEWRWFSSRDTVFKRDADGRVTQILGNSQDITRRKQAEQEMFRSRDLREAIFNESADALFLVDPDTLVTLDCNDRAVEMFEAADKAELIHIEGHTLQRSQFTAEELGEIVKDIETQGFWSQEIEYVTRKGNPFWGNLAAKRITVAGRSLNLVRVTDIRDRKRAEVALRESEATNRALIAAIPDLLIRMDAEGHYEAINQQNAQLLAPSSPRTNSTIHDVIPAEAVAQRLSYVRLAIETDSLQLYEQTIEVNGQLRYEEVRVVSLLGQEALCIIRDVTEQKQIEAERKQAELALQQLNEELEQRVQQRTQDLQAANQQLRDSEARFQTLAAAAPVGIYRTDGSGQCLYVNDRWCQIAGLSPAEAKGTGWGRAVHPDDRNLVFQAWSRFVETATIFRLEYRFQRPDGTSTWIFGQAVQEIDEQGAVKGYVGTVTDISDRKRVEEERQQAEASLKQSERDLRTIFNNVYDAIFIHEMDATILDCNDRALELHGATRERILAATVADLSAPDASLAYISSVFERVQAGEMLQFEWICRRLDDGSTFDAEVSIQQVILGDRPVVIASVRDIRDRKLAERALQDSEERFRQLAENVGEVFWLTTLQAKLLYLSPVFEQVWGRSTRWLFDPANSLLDTIHPDDRGWVKQHMKTKLEGNYDIEYRILRPDGEVRWIRDRAFLIRNKVGKVYRIGGIAADITERRNTEQLIRDREVRFRSVVESNMLGIGFWNGTGVTYANEALLSMIGYTAEEVQKGLIDWQALTPPEYWQQDQEAYLQTQATGACIPYEKEYICKDGTRIPILMGGGHFEGDKQRGAFFVLDIRDRKRAELALRESQQFAQSIADKTPAALYIYDLVNQRNLYSNRSIFDLLGYTSLEIQSMGTEVMSILLHPDDQPKLVQHHQALALATDDDDLKLEYRMRHANGEWRWFYSRDGVFKRDEQNRVTQYIGAAQDITERKQFEQKLQQINAELERRVEERTLDLQQAMEAAETANRAKSTFLANMSHELRTPLNAILGFAQLISRDRSLDTDKREQLSIINRSGKHLLNLINDILEMSKIEAGRIQFNPGCFDLYSLLDTLEEMFYLRAVEKGLRLVIDRASTLPQCIRTDENKLRQVLINLLSNAIKFTRQGSVTLRITVEQLDPQDPNYAACHEVALTFAVQDTGIGIDPGEVDAVFEPFIQSEKRQSQEGTGLGLPISRQFVQLMGGDLTVYSTLEVGSTFTFTIPVHVAEAADTPASPLPQPILSIAEGQPSYRILVVEDHEPNRQLLVQLLQSVGFEVRSAVNGQEAIALWQSWHPQLIWMDMRMPVMDGYTATQQIRSLEAGGWMSGRVEEWMSGRVDESMSGRVEEWMSEGTMGAGEQESRGAGEQNNTQSDNFPNHHPPTHPPTHSLTHPPTHPPTIIIALTANAFEEERARVLNVGCNDFMRKPFQETELLEKIGDYLKVQYRYGELDEKPLPQASAGFDAIAALKTLPVNQLQPMHQATLELNSSQLTRLVAQIALDQPMLAHLLMEKIENFELQQIFDWLQAAMQDKR